MFPHCDADVLHSPGRCKYCDECPELQNQRIIDGVNFTGEDHPDKTPCPATLRRPVEVIEKWYGNVPADDNFLAAQEAYFEELERLLELPEFSHGEQ